MIPRDELVLACRTVWDELTTDLDMVDEGEALTGKQVQGLVFTAGLGRAGSDYGFAWQAMKMAKREDILSEAFPEKEEYVV